MSNGIDLTLMVGPLVAVPVSQVVLDALTDVQITTNTGEPSGFQLTFTLSNESPLHTFFLLAGGNMIPILRVIIIATLNAIPNVLMDGVVTHHQVMPGTKPGQSSLTITGSDLTKVMDYSDFSNLPGFPFPAMPPEARVEMILAKYSIFGMIPLVIPSMSSDIPSPTDRVPTQQGTDFAYINELAREAGHVFYIEPGPLPGMNTAYWGPEIKVGIPQSALNTDMDAHTNTESMSFSFNADAVKVPLVYVQNPVTKTPIPIPIPDISPLNPPLGLIQPLPKELKPLEGAAKLSVTSAVMQGMAEASRSNDAVSCIGSLDVVRYGTILKARQLVGVRGAGPAFDGLYYVQEVTHKIKLGEYKQSFTLTRNGLVSTAPLVPP